MERRNYLLIKYEDWPFSIWEDSDEMEQNPARGFTKAYALFKESTQRRKKKERGVITISSGDEDEKESVESHTTSSKRFKTSIFHTKVHPLTLHMKTLTVGTLTRLKEVGIASCLQPDRETSFHYKVIYEDTLIGNERDRAQKKSKMSVSDFKGIIGDKWMRGIVVLREKICIKEVYTWLKKNARPDSGEPLWITIDSNSLAFFRMKMKMYQGENRDWKWVVGGFTTWNRIQRYLGLIKRDGVHESQDNRRLKDYQEQEEKLPILSNSAKEVAFNMTGTVTRVASTHFIQKDMENEFCKRTGEKNWNLFADATCLKGKELRRYRGPNGNKVELCDKYFDQIQTWDSLKDMKVMKKSAMERGFDMLPEGVEKKKVVPNGTWNIINEQRHAICPINNCGQLQRVSKLGQHLERDHQSERVIQRVCQVCREIVSVSDLENHTNTMHSPAEYQMFWVINKTNKEVTCPECTNLHPLNKFNMLSHMKEKHGWTEEKNPPGGAPLCWICEEKVSLRDLNKHLFNHLLKINLLMD